jgi:prephenate dehydrogenase
MSDPSDYNVVVVGIGAMGGGMAQAILDSLITNSVIGVQGQHRPPKEDAMC